MAGPSLREYQVTARYGVTVSINTEQKPENFEQNNIPKLEIFWKFACNNIISTSY